MAFKGTTGVNIGDSAYQSKLLSIYTTHDNADMTPLSYAGGYDYDSPISARYRLGLLPFKSMNQVDKLYGTLIWGYRWTERYLPDYHDPDYLNGGAYLSATARYVSERDYLSWGNLGFNRRLGGLLPQIS